MLISIDVLYKNVTQFGVIMCISPQRGFKLNLQAPNLKFCIPIPAPFLGNSALSPTLQMNPISSGICVPPSKPARPSKPMDGTFLGITYPLPVTSIPFVTCGLRSQCWSEQNMHFSFPRENFKTMSMCHRLSTTDNSQEHSEECFDCQKAFLTLSSLANQRQIHCQQGQIIHRRDWASALGH